MRSVDSDVEAHGVLEGFRPWSFAGPFVPELTPMFFKAIGKDLVFRVEILAKHCNGHEVAHGGFIATMADTWLAYNVAHRLPEEARFATSNLNVQYLKPARAGRWITSVIDRVKLGPRLCYASGAIVSGTEPVAAATAVFAMLNPTRHSN